MGLMGNMGVICIYMGVLGLYSLHELCHCSKNYFGVNIRELCVCIGNRYCHYEYALYICGVVSQS